MNPVDAKSSIYFNLDEKNNKKDLELKVGDNVRISKWKNSFIKAMFQIAPKKFCDSKS